MAPEPTQGDALALILAVWNRADLEAALDQADTRQAAAGLAWLMAQVIALSGKTPADYLAGLRVAILSEHLRQPPSAQVT